MNILCNLFGHRPAFGCGGIEGTGYFKVASVSIDGINRHHMHLICECERCGVTYRVGNVHIPSTYIIPTPRKPDTCLNCQGTGKMENIDNHVGGLIQCISCGGTGET